ncbi:MAG: metal ABC transporter permease [Elusimicrobia bacterium]|jgi:zinc transport system permease protein|nr:metal ABC transporter permease [Elusimicrobiota bacterium]
MTFLALPFMRTAFVAALLAGTTLSLVGIFSTTRNISFSGLAASQLAALGGVVGILLGLHMGASLFSWSFVLAGLLALSFLSRSRRASADSWVATLYVLGAALAVLLLSKSPRGESEVLGIFFGNILSLGPVEVWEAVGLFGITIVGLGLWFRRWVWLAFDPVGAEVAGLRVTLWQGIFQVFFAGALTLSIHVLGVLLSFAYLILPATAGLLLVRQTRGLVVFCLVSSVLTTGIGFELSFRWDFPTGPFVATLLALLAIGARLYAGRKGEG